MDTVSTPSTEPFEILIYLCFDRATAPSDFSLQHLEFSLQHFPLHPHKVLVEQVGGCVL